MKIADQLTQQKFLEILTAIYSEGQKKGNIQLHEFMDDIKQRILSIIQTDE